MQILSSSLLGAKAFDSDASRYCGVDVYKQILVGGMPNVTCDSAAVVNSDLLITKQNHGLISGTLVEFSGPITGQYRVVTITPHAFKCTVNTNLTGVISDPLDYRVPGLGWSIAASKGNAIAFTDASTRANKPAFVYQDVDVNQAFAWWVKGPINDTNLFKYQGRCPSYEQYPQGFRFTKRVEWIGSQGLEWVAWGDGTVFFVLRKMNASYAYRLESAGAYVPELPDNEMPYFISSLQATPSQLGYEFPPMTLGQLPGNVNNTSHIWTYSENAMGSGYANAVNTSTGGLYDTWDNSASSNSGQRVRAIDRMPTPEIELGDIYLASKGRLLGRVPGILFINATSFSSILYHRKAFSDFDANGRRDYLTLMSMNDGAYVLADINA